MSATSESVVELCYGKSRLPVRLPALARPTVIRKPQMPIQSDPRSAVLRALDSPVGSIGDHPRSLKDLAATAQSACIVICDITRPVPNHLFLRPLIEKLTAAGMNADNITVLVATGLHRPNLGAELEELVGDPWVLDTVEVVNHDARDRSQMSDLGSTATRGTPVKINRRLVEADLRIVTGLVEPHFMAGYSGGRKVIAPGVAHADTITTFHNFSFMSDPASINCNLQGNPLHEEQLEIVKLLGGAYAINTVIDEDRNLSFVNFGEITASHAEAVRFIEEYCRVPVADHFPIVLTSSAGYPLDKTYYQTVKGMVGAMDILAPGGNLLIASECSEGLGSAEYIEAQKKLTTLGVDRFLATLKPKSFAAIDEWQTQMQTKPMSLGKIFLKSELSPEDIALTGVEPVEDLTLKTTDLLEQSPDPRIAIIPEGPYVIPFVDKPES